MTGEGGASADGPVVEGLVVVDKPAGWTSHDVVARVRRLAGTRRVGHAGTLDPMATGVLVLGLGRATRLLGHLTHETKEYLGTIRLGAATTTDDAEGEPLVAAGPERARVTWSMPAAVTAMRRLTGEIDQVPPSYSAIKVSGRRAYAAARAGEPLTLESRRVLVSEFALLDARGNDLDVRVVCSAGTYVRSLARDLGADLGVGGHLAALRRTRVGPFGVAAARTLDQLADRLVVLSLADAVAVAFPRRDVDAEQARGVLHGRPLPAVGERGGRGGGPVGVFGPDGAVLALVKDRGATAWPVCVFSPT